MHCPTLLRQKGSDAKRPAQVLRELGVSLKAIGHEVGLDISVRDGVLLTNALPTVAQRQQGLYASREQGLGGSLHSCRRQEMWRKSLSINSSFCKALVSTGYLTWQQMLDAVCRYRLGADRKGRVIFWQIDRDERICDGKVMAYGPDCHRLKEKEHAPTWVSALLAKRHGGKQEGDIVRHCLFGLHLLNSRNAWLTGQMTPDFPCLGTTQTDDCQPLWQDGSVLQPAQASESKMGEGELPKAGTAQADDSKPHWQEGTVLQPAQTPESRIREGELPPVAVVEAEKTAVILSAYYPQYVWLATGGLFEVQPEKFRPLKGRKVILFPDADPDGKAYAYWFEAAQQVMAQPYWDDSPPIRVSALLEQHATADQRHRKIDLVEFITEQQLTPSRLSS